MRLSRLSKMKNLLLTVLAFGLLLSSPFAEEGLEKKQFSRVVPSRTNQRIGFYTALNPDCTAQQGNFSIRVTKTPEHGSVETIDTMNFPSYSKENIRAKCNQHKVKGIQVNYKSEDKYVGTDELELLALPQRIRLGSPLRDKRALISGER
jgi:hypothetical protein